MSAVRRLRLAALLAVCAVLATGCRIELTSALHVRADGSGSAGLVVDLDAAAVEELDELRVDPFAEVAAAVLDTPGWELRREQRDGGGMRVLLQYDAADPAALTAALRELTDGLAAGDPALFVDLDLTVDAEGAARLSGSAWLRPPATAGAVQDEVPIGPHGEDLAALVADHVHAAIEVTLPGPVLEHDADEVADAADGFRLTAGPQTLRWELPSDGPRQVQAVAGAPGGLPAWTPVAAGGLLAVLVLVLAVWWWRRR